MSKQIKQLKPYYRDLDEDEKAYMRSMRKLRAFEKWLEIYIPDDITGTYSFCNALGEYCPRLFIYLDKNEDSTIALLKWLSKLKKHRFQIEKLWRENDGYFSYRAERKYGKYGSTSFIILFEQTANIDGCHITKKKVIKEVYVTDCEPIRTIL